MSFDISMGLGSVIGAGMGMINQKQQQDREYKQTKQLMNQQLQNQQTLNRQGKELALEQWKDTMFPEQVKQMEEAGLSVGLMYGKGGAGGATAQTGSGGSASMGSAPKAMPMDIGAAQMMDMMANIDVKKAQAENIREDTDLKKEQGSKTYQEGMSTYLDNALKRFRRSRPDEVQADRSSKYGQGSIAWGSYEYRTTEAEANTAEQTFENMEADEQKTIVQSIESATNAELNKAKKRLTEEQTNKIYHDILVNYINAGLKGLDTIVKSAVGVLGAGAVKGLKGAKMPANQIGGLSKRGF